MAIDEDLRKKIADRLASRTPEQKQLSQQNSKESAIRERIRNVSNKSSEFKAPLAVSPVKDTTVRIPFTNKRSTLGKDNLLGSFARLSHDVFTAVVESTTMGVVRSISQIKKNITGEELKIPGLKVSTDLSFGGNNLQTIEDRVPTFSEAAIKRQSELDKKRPNYKFLNTLQAASEEIFLPLWDAVPVIGAATHAMINATRRVAISPAAREAMVVIGFKPSADKAITEASIRTSIKKTARQHIEDLEGGKISPEEYLLKQTELGRAVDVLNDGQTRYGQFGSTLNKIADSLTQERTFGKASVEVGSDGVPVIRTVDESIETTQNLLRQQNKALRGEMESMRLSNADILAKAIKDAKLADEITPESSLDVFTIGNRQLKPGTRVSLDREVARGIAGNSPRQVGVIASDLVKLPDGSFVYAPKSTINSGKDAISTIRKTVRDEIVQREKFAQTQKKVRESIERAKRLADAQEAARIAKEDATKVARETARKTEAQKVVSDAKVTLAKRKAEVDVSTAKEIAKLKAVEKVAKSAVSDSVSKVRTATKNVKDIEKKITAIKKAIAKAKKAGKATDGLEKKLVKAKASLKLAKSTQRFAETTLNKAKKNVPTDIKAKEAEIKAKADIRKAELLDESKKAVKEANAIIKEIDNANKIPKPNKKQAERLQNKIDNLKSKKAKLIDTYGGLKEVPPEKLKEIDDAIKALQETSGDVKVADTVKTGEKISGGAKKVDEVLTPSEKVKPVKIEGTDTKVSTLMDKLNKGLEGVESSPEFNVATHAKQSENALGHIAKNGIDNTLKMAEAGSFPANTTKASLVSALMESIEAVTDPALKLNYTNRLANIIPELSEFATRAGQEIEALKMLHKDNPVFKVMQIQKKLNSEGAIKKTAEEVARLEKQLSKIDTKSIIKESIDKVTCQK